MAHLADVNGDGLVDAADETLVRNALLSRRGYGLRARGAFDMRADVFGRGEIDRFTLDAVRDAVRTLAGTPAARARRPITVAWHYGWYNPRRGRSERQTVRFRGGDYASRDPEFESIFNEQKNEFGITVDALSWIPTEFNLSMLDNYRRGYFSANGLNTRHVALLYESTIALPVSADERRVDFFDPRVATRLAEDFRNMAEFLLEARDQAGARVFRLDERPVIFIFGSHTWGLARDGVGQLLAADTAFDQARQAFRQVYGRFPYVVGEEMFLSTDGTFSDDRRHRTAGFDAIHIYHHASNLKPTLISGSGDVVLELSQSYIDNQAGILRSTYQSVADITNRHTGRPVHVIPNLSPGFAKRGLPTLLVRRRPYVEFMQRLEQVHLEHLDDAWSAQLGTSTLPAPVYVVGSWNEEFEGHSVFPARFNESVGAFEQRGFDLVMAIKEVFGWNHYAERAIPT